MSHYIATVHILIIADDAGQAADTVSALLTENGIYAENTGVVDWSYLGNGTLYQHPTPVEIATDYDRDEANLCAIAAQAYLESVEIKPSIDIVV